MIEVEKAIQRREEPLAYPYIPARFAFKAQAPLSKVDTRTVAAAAGIDIGSASHFVAVSPDRDDEPVQEFKSFTEDLEELADWLVCCGVDTVAMESTSIFSKLSQ